MENSVIKEATFDPAVKTYIFLIVLFYLFVSIAGIILIPFWLLGLGQWLSNKYFHTLKCQLSAKNLKFSKGIVFRIEKTVPLENIQDLSFYGGPILRSMGLTMIKIETAGGGGQHHSNAMSMLGVIEAENFKNLILGQREIVVREKNQVVTHASGSAGSGQSEQLLNDIKNELSEIKNILKTNTKS
jgi:putative membrane protein